MYLDIKGYTMNHRYVIFKSPSLYDLDILEYVKSRICNQSEIAIEIEQLNKTADNCYYWYQCDRQYKPTED